MTPEEIAAMKAENEKYKIENEALKKPKDAERKEEPKDLGDKVREQNDEKAAKGEESRKLEAALKFTLSSGRFVEENKSILPKEISDIFVAAEKERYDSAIDKANAVKSAVIQSFFSVQSNLDLTTPTHKEVIADYLKLTKKGREDKADEIFRNVFEPTLEMVKLVKKAEEVAKSRSGHLDPSDADKAYKEKLINGSRAHYLGEKKYGT